MTSTKKEPEERQLFTITLFDRNGCGLHTEVIKAKDAASAKQRARAIAKRERLLVGSFYITDADGIGVGYGEIGQK